MLFKLIMFVVIAVILGVNTFWLLTIPSTIPASALTAYQSDSGRGRTMFFAGGCASCHQTPGQDDKLRLGGGLALKSPFGTFNVPNISPDPIDGIGRWSEADFVTAMAKGTSPDGRHYYPAFPYSSYQRMSQADIRDLFAFIRTLTPMQGRVRDHELTFPFGIRRLVGGWKLLFLDGKPFEPTIGQSAEWNRGSYLVNGPGHCAECHSPRNALGGIISDKRFTGGADPEGEGWIPNITQHSLRSWSPEDIATMLSSGDKPDGDSVSGSMGKVVSNTRQLSGEDRAAMAIYLKSLPAVEGVPQPPRKQP